MRKLLLVATMVSASLGARVARADDAASNVCRQPKCTCSDAEASSDCLDAKSCGDFCERHDGIAESARSGYNLPKSARHRSKKPKTASAP